MTRKNISKAVSDISDTYLMEALVGIADNVTEYPGEVIEMNTGRFTFKKNVYSAVAVCVVLALGITAYAAGARILMRFQKTGPEISVDCDSVDDSYIDLGTWLPAEIPDGYETDFVSDPFYGSQSIIYKNDKGNTLRFEYAKAGQFDAVTISNVLSEEDVSVCNYAGKLYKQLYSQNLFWANDAEGIGYLLHTDDLSLNLIAIAESVKRTETPLVPTLSEGLTRALEELGDYAPTLIPDAYSSVSVTGLPRSEGGGWYAYVRKRFTDKTKNKNICFSYETCCSDDDTEFTAEEILALINAPGADVSVNGMPGILDESSSSVYWVDPEHHLTFMLSADDLQGSALLELADSVRCVSVH